MSQDILKPAHLIYSEFVEQGARRELAEYLWGTIPKTMGDAYKVITKIREKYGVPTGDIESFKKSLKKQQRDLGILTGKVKESIDGLDAGVVEAGQQPMCLGGPSLILNKIAYAYSLCGLGSDGFVPVFYNADYDGVQPELLNIRLPSPSPRGLLVTYPTTPIYESSPIRLLPNPSEKWLKDTVEKVESNYRGMLKGVKPGVQERLMINLKHALTVLKTSYYSTDNVSDWTAKTLGILLNIESDLGVPVLSPSDPLLRPHFQSGYETLLSEPNRMRFIEASNEAAEKVEDNGFRSQIGVRQGDYVPFFLECMSSGCNRARVELKYVAGLGSSASVKGKCPRCEEEYEFSFNSAKPDLTEMIDWVTPRVDSRQVIADSVMPILAHIGGPGETSYYAEVIPAVRQLDIVFPVYLRYTRAFYNTPWNEVMAGQVKQEGYLTILNEALFGALSQWVQARNSDNGDAMAEAHKVIRGSIEGSYNELLGRAEALNSEVNDIKRQLGKVKDRGPLIKEMRTKQNQAHKLDHYMSWAYGRFSPERFGQEVSWAWVDLAMVSGLGDLMGVYLRQYNRFTPNSSMYFINTG
ncbi:MAG: bacillithiol biosynthesis BshC [Candidatus Bathyarchaeota archaeon]|nr:bacillithiol biosynthesis BshC [Candidatus Bathyarchaeota archaeon]